MAGILSGVFNNSLDRPVEEAGDQRSASDGSGDANHWIGPDGGGDDGRQSPDTDQPIICDDRLNDPDLAV